MRDAASATTSVSLSQPFFCRLRWRLRSSAVLTAASVGHSQLTETEDGADPLAVKPNDVD